MSQLKAETMSMVGLNLFQQLSHLTQMANSSFDEQLSEDQVCVQPKRMFLTHTSVYLSMCKDLWSNSTHVKRKSIYSVGNNLHRFYLQSFSEYDSAVAVMTSLVQSVFHLDTCLFCIPRYFIYCTCVFRFVVWTSCGASP